MNMFPETGAQWIWLRQDKREINQYVEFRHEFTLDEGVSENAKLFLSVDSDYAVWINGRFVGFGQYSDFPQYKIYDVLAVSDSLKQGRNVLCVLAYYQGVSSSEYIEGEPGLIYALKTGGTNVISSEEVICRKSPAYSSGPADRISPQLGFTFEYDGRNSDNWLDESYKAGDAWERAQVKEGPAEPGSGSLIERPVSKLVLKERVNASIVSQGAFIRIKGNSNRLSHLIQTDYLSSRKIWEVFTTGNIDTLPADGGLKINPSVLKDSHGIYMVLDLEREEAGLLELELEAEAGTVIDVAYGEHLNDLRVRAEVGNRNFANRYVCKDGRQKFIHYFTRLGCRYIELHISNAGEGFKLYYAGLRPTEYPIEQKGSFECSDLLNNKIYEVAARTLHLCMHEHYEDCPWREQALYSMDSRNQALCGYYSFGEYDFPQAAFALLGKGLREDGYLELCAPASVPITIPCFSMVWIIELAEHYMFSGRLEPVKAAMPAIRKMLGAYAANIQNGLLATPYEKQYWNFYEWAPGLDGTDIFKGNYQGLNTVRFDAPLNLFFKMALDSAALLSKACNDMEACNSYIKLSEQISEVFHITFWNEEKQAYKTYYGESCVEHFSELTQALAICSNACSAQTAAILRQKLAQRDSGLVGSTLSHSFYKYEALLGEPERFADFVFNRISEDWGYMLYNNATSFWETIKGSRDFDAAGSLCHGWSSIPVYFYFAYILGIKPVEPGFKTFRVEPVSSIFNRAAGKIPTPYGDIIVNVEKKDGKIAAAVSHPDEINLIDNTKRT